MRCFYLYYAMSVVLGVKDIVKKNIVSIWRAQRHTDCGRRITFIANKNHTTSTCTVTLDLDSWTEHLVVSLYNDQQMR
jgi:hypothetical protein